MIFCRLITNEMPVTLAQTIGQPANQLHRHDSRGAALLALPHIGTEAGRNRLFFGTVDKCNEVVLTSENFKRMTIKNTSVACNKACVCPVPRHMYVLLYDSNCALEIFLSSGARLIRN